MITRVMKNTNRIGIESETGQLNLSYSTLIINKNREKMMDLSSIMLCNCLAFSEAYLSLGGCMEPSICTGCIQRVPCVNLI